MAKGLIEIALQLGSKLGANTSKFLGTRSNVSFLGTGPKDGMLFQKEINPESFATIGIEKVIPDIESSLAYATGGKLNDIELSTLIKNLKTMDETLNPTNVVEMGIDSLRAKSGIGERQLTEAASDVRSIDDAAAGVNQADAEGILSAVRVGNPFDDYKKNVLGREDVSASGGQFLDKFSEIRGRAPAPLETGSATAIMETIPKVDLPGKRAASREFLVNSLKVGDDYPSTTLSDVMSAEDMKFIMEGGGGVMGDPIVLVQKYFGPRIAEMVPTGGTAEEISIFTRRVMDNVEDAKGLKPDEPDFDPLTAKFMEEFSEGTYSFGSQKGKEFQSNVNSMGKGTLKQIIDSGELMGDDLEAALNALRSRKAYGGRIGYKDGYSVQDDIGDYAANVGKTAAPGGGFVGDGGNVPGVGGITSVVPTKNPGFFDYVTNPITSLQKFAGVYKNPEDEEDEENKVSKMTTAANKVTNFKDYNTKNQKAADIAAAFAKKENLYAKGGRAGYAKGGLAKILEL